MCGRPTTRVRSWCVGQATLGPPLLRPAPRLGAAVGPEGLLVGFGPRRNAFLGGRGGLVLRPCSWGRCAPSSAAKFQGLLLRGSSGPGCASPGRSVISGGLPTPSPSRCSVPGIHASLRSCSSHVHSWFPLPPAHSELVGKAACVPPAAEFRAGQNQNPGLWGPSVPGLPLQHPLSLWLKRVAYTRRGVTYKCGRIWSRRQRFGTLFTGTWPC